MKLNNGLIIGANSPTNANGKLARVCEGGFSDFLKNKKKADKLFLSSLDVDESVLDKFFTICHDAKPQIIVSAGMDLYTSGRVDAKFGLSPIMLLYRAGVLNERCTVAGGICLDRDEIELMAALKAKLVVCPTYCCGNGFGLPLVTSAVGKLDISLGTYDNAFNASGDIIEEAKTLYVGTSSIMRKRDCLDLEALSEIAGANDFEEFVKAMNLKN